MARLPREMVTELSALLDQMVGLQEAMVTTIDHKLAAMRRADVEAMQVISRDEGELAGKVVVLDRRRLDLTAELCAALNLPGRERARAMTLTHLASRVEVSLRPGLLQRAQTLREVMLKVARANEIVEKVCRELQAHFKSMFAAMVQDESQPTYGRGGVGRTASGANVLDAVG